MCPVCMSSDFDKRKGEDATRLRFAEMLCRYVA